jgi:hypothetical protein
MSMKYRGVEYTIIQGTQPDVWKWRVMVGKPEMLRMGEAIDLMHAELQVRHIIDRSLKLQERLGKSDSTNKSKAPENFEAGACNAQDVGHAGQRC